MAIFEYSATDSTGNSVDGTFEAIDEQDALNILAQYNLSPTRLSQQGAAPSQAATPAMDLGGSATYSGKDSTKKGKSSSKNKNKRRKVAYWTLKLAEVLPTKISLCLPVKCPL